MWTLCGYSAGGTPAVPGGLVVGTEEGEEAVFVFFK